MAEEELYEAGQQDDYAALWNVLEEFLANGFIPGREYERTAVEIIFLRCRMGIKGFNHTTGDAYRAVDFFIGRQLCGLVMKESDKLLSEFDRQSFFAEGPWRLERITH